MGITNGKDYEHVISVRDPAVLIALRNEKMAELAKLRVRILEVRGILIMTNTGICQRALAKRGLWENSEAIFTRQHNEPRRVKLCGVVAQQEYYRDDDSAWITFRQYTKKGKPGKMIRATHASQVERFDPVT